jgi:hypothetical protein
VELAPEDFQAICDRYGLEMQLDSVPELCRRFGLEMPPAGF